MSTSAEGDVKTMSKENDRSKRAEMYVLDQVVSSAYLAGFRGAQTKIVAYIDLMLSGLNGMNKHDRSKRDALNEVKAAASAGLERKP